MTHCWHPNLYYYSQLELEPHHQIQFSLISNSSFGWGWGLTFLSECSQRILSLANRANCYFCVTIVLSSVVLCCIVKLRLLAFTCSHSGSLICRSIDVVRSYLRKLGIQVHQVILIYSVSLLYIGCDTKSVFKYKVFLLFDQLSNQAYPTINS